MRKFTKMVLTLALLFGAWGGVKSQVVFDIDATGKATIDKAALVGDGGLTFNTSTGELSSNGSEGSLTLVFADPVDLRNLKNFNVVNSGQVGDILDNLKFYDKDNNLINTWNSIKLGNMWNASGIDDNATNAFLNHDLVKKMVWPSAANGEKNGKTGTITRVEFIFKTITRSYSNPGETQLNTLTWNKIDGSGTATPDWNMNGSSDTYYGDYSGNATHYADLTDYSELRVYCESSSDGFRAFFIKKGVVYDKDDPSSYTSQTNTYSTSAATWHPTEKYYSLDLSTVEKWDGKVALKSIKSDPWSGTTTGQNVTDVEVYKAPAFIAQYVLLGSGIPLADAKAVLDDPDVTSIDATAITGITTNSAAGRTQLTSANPNCLIYGTVGDGKLANTKNVITSGVCANLEITDGHPFQAPTDFTATTATYSTTINATAKAGTLCLPYEATIPSGVKAYKLKYTGGSTVTAEKLTGTIPANTPVLINGDGAADFDGASVSIDADATNTEAEYALTGVFKAGYVPAESYVLQMPSGVESLGFYRVKDANTVTINPFRAYLTSTATARSLSIVFEDEETTGIQNLTPALTAGEGAVYNLNGQRVEKAAKGLYIRDGKKYFVK